MIITFRNDDVRGALDQALVEITNLFVKYEIPISHAVEPGNVTPEVISWLKSIKQQHPNLIEIIQHGYKHKLNIHKYYGGKKRKGEFGLGRNYQDQYEEVLKGKDLMNKYFGDSWFHSFTFPYGGKDDTALKAVDDVGYLVMNDHKGVSIQHKLFYTYGQVLRKNFVKGRSISYHLKKRPGTNLFNIDMNISIITKYHDEISSCDMLDINELKKRVKLFESEPTIGIIIHHRYHNSKDKIQLVDDFLAWCSENPSFEFTTQENIFNTFSK